MQNRRHLKVRVLPVVKTIRAPSLGLGHGLTFDYFCMLQIQLQHDQQLMPYSNYAPASPTVTLTSNATLPSLSFMTRVQGLLYCPKCTFKTDNPNRMKEHVYKHTGVHYFVCRACLAMFPTHYRLQHHRQNDCQGSLGCKK